MHIYSRIKNILSLSSEKKKSAFLSGDIASGVLPIKNEQIGAQKNRVSSLKNILRRKRYSEKNMYSSQPKARESRKIGRYVIVATVLLFFFACGGAGLILQRFQGIEYFKVTDISISGESVLSKTEVRTITGIIAHQTSLLGLEIVEMENRLRSNSWISSATVRRNWPSGIEIDIVENRPLALLHIKTAKGTELKYIDKKGRSFLSLVPGGKVDYPIVTGLSELDDKAMKSAALKEVLIFLNKAKRNDPHLPVQSLSEVHVTKEGDLVVYLVEYPFPIFFGNGNTKRKYGRLVEVLKALYKKEKGKDLISEVEYIQMDYLQDKVLVAQSGQG